MNEPRHTRIYSQANLPAQYQGMPIKTYAGYVEEATNSTYNAWSIFSILCVIPTLLACPGVIFHYQWGLTEEMDDSDFLLLLLSAPVAIVLALIAFIIFSTTGIILGIVANEKRESAAKKAVVLNVASLLGGPTVSAVSTVLWLSSTLK